MQKLKVIMSSLGLVFFTLSCVSILKPSGQWKTNPKESLEWNEGARLAHVVLACGKCHAKGVDSKNFDVNSSFTGRGFAPDITNLKAWTKEDFGRFFQEGVKPSGDTAGPSMRAVNIEVKALNKTQYDQLISYLLNQNNR